MKDTRLLGASLLVAGTSIGAAMLALPLASAEAGFTNSIVILCVSWFFMYGTGLCIIEVASAFEDSHSCNFVSMAEKTIGPWGGRVTAVSFFCLLYSLLAAYITGGGDICQQYITSYWPTAPELIGPVIWTSLFAAVIYFGVVISDNVNRVLMFALFVIYGLLSFFLSKQIDVVNLANHGGLHYVLIAIPVVFTTHAYHVVIPSVFHYLDNNAKDVKKALLFGSLIPLLLYMIWEYVVFGALPLHGDKGLLQISQSSHTTSDLISAFAHLTQHPMLNGIGHTFVFFAIASSFLGVSLGLFDMLGDMFAADKLKRFSRLLLTFVPGLLFCIVYPGGFMLALSYAGIFVAILHGFLPVWMVLGKRKRQLQSAYTVPGGQALQVLLFMFYLFVILLDVSVSAGFL